MKAGDCGILVERLQFLRVKGGGGVRGEVDQLDWWLESSVGTQAKDLLKYSGMDLQARIKDVTEIVTVERLD